VPELELVAARSVHRIGVWIDVAYMLLICDSDQAGLRCPV
jgi:hypothetical protein